MKEVLVGSCVGTPGYGDASFVGILKPFVSTMQIIGPLITAWVSSDLNNHQ